MKPLEPGLAAMIVDLNGREALSAISRSALVSTDSATGAALERIVVSLHGRSTSYVVKRIDRFGDWLARATDDRLVRECQLAESGIFDRLPNGVASATLGACLTSTGAVILMRDVAVGIPPSGDVPLTLKQTRVAIRGLCRMHSATIGFSPEAAGRLGLNTLENWLTSLSPRTAYREGHRRQPDAVTPNILPGWRAFAELAPRAWGIAQPLLENPAPFATLLLSFPPTLVHGDAKFANFAVIDDELVLLDWSTATVGPGALDLAWFLCINAAKLPLSRNVVIEMYRKERERLGVLPSTGPEWDLEITLAMSTSALRLGWLRALTATVGEGHHRDWARQEVQYWSERLLDAREWLVR